MQLQLVRGDLLNFDGDAIVIPIASDGQMADGIARRVKEIEGPEIENAVKQHAPIAVGAALVTDTKHLSVPKVINVPVIEDLGQRVGVENIRRATRASLLAAVKYQMTRIATKGFGYGEFGVSPEEAARAVNDEVVGYKGGPPITIVLVEDNDELYEAFSEYVKSR